MRRLTGLLFLLAASFATPLHAQEAAPETTSPVTGFVADEINLRVSKPSELYQLSGKTQLILRFCETKDDEKNCTQPSRSVQTAGRKVENIKIEPNIAGEWRFSSDYTLNFTPEKFWRGHTNYTVTLPADLFPPHVKRDTNTYTFTSAPLHATIDTMDFLQDPNDATKKLVTARLNFNYPVNRNALKQALHFTMEGKSNDLPATLDFFNDDASVNASVSVEKLEKTQQYMKLFVAQTVSAADDSSMLTARPQTEGQKKKDNEFNARVLIPSLYDYLQVKSLQAQVLKNAQYVPQQLIALEANAPLKPKDIGTFIEAKLLPKDKPVEGASPKKDYAWSGPAEVTQAIRGSLESVALTVQNVEAPASPVAALSFAAQGGRYLLVTVKKGLPAQGGYELGREYETVIQVPELPREVRVMAEGALLSLSGEKKLSILSLGVNGLQYEVGRVKEENLNHLISQTYGRFADPEFVNSYQFGEHNISRVFREERKLAPKDLKQPNFSSFDFSPYLQDGGKGLFLLKITGQQTTTVTPPKPEALSWWQRTLAFFGKAPKKDAAPDEPETKTSATQPEKRFILVTDLGLIVKKNLDGTQDVFVQSINGGGPIGGVEIAALGLNGEPVATAATDGEGHATLPNLEGFKDEKRPVAITARKGGDLSFLPYGRYDRELNYSKFDVEGERASEGLNGYVFSDRGIYRPGETAHLGIIVKAKDWAKSQKDLPLILEVVNPRGQVADKQILALSEEGLISADFTPSETATTGIYNANLYLGRDKGEKGAQIATAPLRVEEFQPDRMKMSSNFTQFGQSVENLAWVKPEQLSAEVTLMHLYGAPAKERRVTAKLALSPSGFGLHTFKDYTFTASNGIEKTFEETLPESKTNDQGIARFSVDLTKYLNSTFRLTFYGEGFEPESGRSVKTAKSVLVSPLDYALGVKADGNLNYIHVGDNRSVALIAVDQKLAKVAANDLTVELKRVKTIQSLTKDNQGNYRYQPTTVETTVKNEQTSVPADGINMALPTAEPGSFLMIYRDAKGTTLARVSFTVVGESNVAGGFSRDATMQVTPDKAAYASGEEISLNIQSPYAGTGLITIETDRVLAWKWFTSEFTNSVQRIRIPKEFEGKGFINVQFTRDLKSKEIFMSPLSFAVVPFTANIDARDQKITLDAPKEAKPGETVTVKYSTRKKGKVVLYAVDEGILLFARYKNPDPLDHFLMKRALEVSTSQIMDLLLPEYSLLKALSAQGGDGWANDGKNLNPFKRKTEPPVAYWSGVIDSDEKPREWKFTVPPYFNGGVRILAVAVSSDAMGTAEAGTHVRGPLIITPNLPLFAAPGDEFDTPVTINNYVKDSGQDAKITLTLEPSSGLAVVDAPKDALPIPEGGEKTVSVKLKATEVLGSASVKFTAASGDTKFTIEQTSSIRPPLPAMTTLMAAYAKETSAIAVNARSLYPEFAKVTATASSLPVSLIGGLKDYLEDYPYGCVEQLTSQNFPNVILYGNAELIKAFKWKPEKMETAIRESFSSLRERQNEAGAWGMWNFYSEPHGFISAYVTHFLLEARERNLPVPEDVFDASLRNLKHNAGEQPHSLEDAREKAYTVYLLTRAGEITTNYLPHITSYLDTWHKDTWHDDLTAVYLAATYQLMEMRPEAAKLLDAFHLEAPVRYTTTKHEYAFYDSLTRYSQYVTLIAKHFPDRLATMDKSAVYRVANFIGEGSYNTVSSAYAVMAIDAYVTASKESVADIAIKALDASGAEKPLTLSGEKLKVAEAKEPVAQFVFTSPQPGFFYQVAMGGYDKILPDKPLAQGLELSRRYVDAEGKELTSVKLGDTVDVVITVRSGNNEALRNVAVVDLLPAGFELLPEVKPDSDEAAAPKPEASDTEAPEAEGQPAKATPWKYDSTDRREDRIIFYGTFQPKVETTRYRLKATARGNFVVPPPYAESMYDLALKARGMAGKITVE